MRRLIHDNILYIFIVLFLFIWALSASFNYYQMTKDRIDDYNYWENNKEQFPNITYLEKPGTEDTFTIFFYTLHNTSLDALQRIFPLFIIIPCGWIIHKELKTGYFKNKLMRMDYKKYMKKTLKKCYSSILILPLLYVFLFIFSYIQSGHFDVYKSNQGLIFFQTNYFDSLFLYMFGLIVGLILISIYFVNITIIVISKNSKYIVSIILSFLIIIGINIYSEVIIAPLSYYYLNIENLNSFALSNYLNHDISASFDIMLPYALILTIISGIFVYKTYNKKEQVIIQNEK